MNGKIKKILKPFLVVFLSAILVFSCLGVTVAAETGDGTQESPYLIKTAAELQNIRNDLSAYYKLAADINLSAIYFIPLGNEEDGAFTGGFDGAGFKISNLTVEEGYKYSGLFGYNEGVIKNVTLKNADIPCTRYAGGIAGYNAADALVNNCTAEVNITGGNDYFDTYAGGIIGYNADNNTISDCTVSGSISFNGVSCGYNGGIIGYNYGVIRNCNNLATISSEESYLYSTAYNGGVVGYNYGTVQNCNNKALVSGKDLTAGSFEYNGGIAGYNLGFVQSCVNFETISGRCYCGGMIGANYSNSIVTDCINYGDVYPSSDWYGNYSRYGSSGGMIGCARSTSTVTDCINYGNVSSSSYSGGMIGDADSTSTVTNCINYGNVSSSSSSSSGGMIGSANRTATVTNCINYKNYYILKAYGDISRLSLLSLSEIKNSTEILERLNSAEELWETDSRFNSGLPILKNSPPLLLNEAVLELKPQQTAKLNAFYNKTATSNVTFTSDDTEVAIVSKDGNVKAVKNGVTSISAVMPDGTKTSCLVYVITPSSSLNIEQSTVSLTNTQSTTLMLTRGNDSNDMVWWKSSDESVVTVDQKGNLSAKKSGTVTITATSLVSGASDTCTVNITSPVTKITIPASASVNIGTPYTITPTVTPSVYDGTLTWTSSNPDVATVSKDGIVNGIKPGVTLIGVKSDTGYYAECNVTVKQPSLYVLFDEKTVELETGLTYKLGTKLYPENSTDTLSFRSSSTSVATVSSDGIITAVRAGTTTITVTASSGVTDTCTVTVKNKKVFPESVTLDTYEANIQVSEAMQLTSTVFPSNATDKTVTWYSLDDSIVTVSNTGVIKGISGGTTTVRAVSSNGIFAECCVNVIDYSNTPKVILSNATVVAGKTVTLDLEIKNNYGFSAMSIDFIHDTDNLELVSCENLIDGFTMNFDKTLDFDGANNFTGNGIIAKLTFKVKNNAPANEYEISAVLDVVNQKMQPVNFEFVNGVITVTNTLCGDSNGDGEINAQDLIVLRQALLTDSEYSEALDANGDGVVDIRDLVRLKKHLANGTPLGKQENNTQQEPLVTEIANIPGNKEIA